VRKRHPVRTQSDVSSGWVGVGTAGNPILRSPAGEGQRRRREIILATKLRGVWALDTNNPGGLAVSRGFKCIGSAGSSSPRGSSL
jgi:hypothetical protein